jgi:signal transduction histidine kinase
MNLARRLSTVRLQPWQIALTSLAGLLIVLAVTGLIGLTINARVKAITEQAIIFDLALEDRGDDFRVAVLDMRHYHRNITFAGPSRGGLDDFEAAYAQLLAQIDRLGELAIDDPRLPPAAGLRSQAEAYYAALRPAIELYETDRRAFALASDDGLLRLSELEDAGRTIDHLGERRAAAALNSVDQAAESAQLVLLTVLGGLTLIGAGLTYLAIRIVREQQRGSLELARALQLKNDFIADASHELRTPLTVLRANAELAMELERSCVHVELLEEILAEADRMTRLVGDLLFLAGSDSGSLPLESEWVDVAPFLAGLAERAQTLAREANCDLRADLRAEGMTLLDLDRIEQAVLILVDNAGKYSPRDTLINLRSAVRDETLIIEVIDRGPGIPENELPFIFERFRRVDKSRNRNQGGAGLGLAIARSIVQAHSGWIEAESSVGVGTIMRIHLPGVKSKQPLPQRMEYLALRQMS